MHDKIERNQFIIVFLKNKCRLIWQEVRQFLSFFDLLGFCPYLAIIDECKEASNQKKNERNMRLLFQHRFGNKARPNKKNIVNLSDSNFLAPRSLFYHMDSTFACYPLVSTGRKCLRSLKCCLHSWSTTNHSL